MVKIGEDAVAIYRAKTTVEIQGLPTRSELLAAVGLAAQIENPLAEIDWPMAVSCSLDSLQ